MPKKKTEQLSKKLNKKERAELERGKHEKKQEKKKEKKQHKELQKKFRVNIAAGWIFATVGILALIGIGIFLFLKLFEAKSLSLLLPQEKTVAFVEIDITDRATRNFFEALQEYPTYYVDTLKVLLYEDTGFDFEREIKPWMGNRAGIAFLQDGRTLQKLIFLETRSKKKTLESFNHLILDKGEDAIKEKRYSDRTLYQFSFGQGFSFTFLDRYVVLADDISTLQALIDVSDAGHGMLRTDPWYVKIMNNLAQNDSFWAYLNIQRFADTSFEGNAMLSNFTQSIVLVRPLLEIFPSIGISASFEKKHIKAQTYLNIKKTTLRDQSFFQFEEKYQGDLLNLVTEENLFYLKGGHNFAKEFQRMLHIFNELHPAAAIIAEGMLRAKKDEYFGSDVSLEDDIYPVLRDEYALALHEKDGVTSHQFLLHLNDAGENKTKLLSLKESFLKTASFAAPQVKEVVLEDGTIGKEIVIADDVPEETEIPYLNYSISALNMGDTTFYYAFVDDLFVLGDNLLNVQYTLSAMQNGDQQSDNFEKVARVFTAADEVNIVDPVLLASHFDFKRLQEYLEPFEYIVFGKNVFEDGISTLYEISLK